MPDSIAIKGRDFSNYVDQGMAPGEFTYRILAEGDSWMERSSAFTASLPDYLARAMVDESVLIINLAIFGDTMRRIGKTISGEYGWWLKQFTFDAILLSAGGNDYIDAARDPAPGQGLLRDRRGAPSPGTVADCVHTAALQSLITDYLDPNFSKLHRATRRSTLNKHTPIFLNQYDTPVARDAPAPPLKRAWLQAAYVKNGIDPSLWPAVTDQLFTSLRDTIDTWRSAHDGVHVVPTNGVMTPADPTATGPSGDWINEIHPTASGWEKLAPVWQAQILSVIKG